MALPETDLKPHLPPKRDKIERGWYNVRLEKTSSSG
jgi:hypothetical protein